MDAPRIKKIIDTIAKGLIINVKKVKIVSLLHMIKHKEIYFMI